MKRSYGLLGIIFTVDIAAMQPEVKLRVAEQAAERADVKRSAAQARQRVDVPPAQQVEFYKKRLQTQVQDLSEIVIQFRALPQNEQVAQRNGFWYQINNDLIALEATAGLLVDAQEADYQTRVAAISALRKNIASNRATLDELLRVLTMPQPATQPAAATGTGASAAAPQASQAGEATGQDTIQAQLKAMADQIAAMQKERDAEKKKKADAEAQGGGHEEGEGDGLTMDDVLRAGTDGAGLVGAKVLFATHPVTAGILGGCIALRAIRWVARR